MNRMNIGRPLLTATQCRQRSDPEHGRWWEERRTCVHRLFEEQVECTPNTLAVEDETCQQTYDQVNRRANRWARHLVDRGLCPGARVALLAEQSAGLVAAMLAIWKAGKVLLPLDPRMPPKQIAHILNAGGCALVLTEDKFVPLLTQGISRLSETDRVPFFYLEELDQLAQAQCNLPNLCTPTDLAYVTYRVITAEAMWKIAVDHRLLAHCLSNLDDDYDLAYDDQNSPFFYKSSIGSQWAKFALWLMTGHIPIDLTRAYPPASPLCK